MRKSILFLALVLIAGALTVEAQGVTCNACEFFQYNYSECSSVMGRVPNCRTYCDALACNCVPGASGGKCTRDADGGYSWKTYNNIRLVDPTVPFELAYTVVAVRITPPGANVTSSALIRRRNPRA